VLADEDTEKGVQELVAQFSESTPTAAFLGIVVALCYWFTIYLLELMPATKVFNPAIRKFLSDYAYPVSNDPIFMPLFLLS